MEGKRLIEKIRLRNILSFGDKGEEIELLPLNVLIGPNASGKSNFIDVIKLLRSLPQEKGLISYISRNGGINEWIWKGVSSENTIEIDVTSNFSAMTKRQLEKSSTIISYNIQIRERHQRLFIVKETIKSRENISINRGKSKNSEESLLSRISEEVELRNAAIAEALKRVFLAGNFYTDLQTNRSSDIRKPQIPDAPNNFLDESGSNLSLVLNDFEFRGKTKIKFIENLRKFYPRIADYSIRILGGTVQLFIREEGLENPISAMRLSDGTLRYLCLLAILCHPEPPPLICIEEPETGLHPDILPTIGELLIEASKRTQLIVTTHSDILVSSFSEVPEAVLVCEADEDGTHLNRLDGEKLKGWLKKHQLGDLWIRGEIGGTRW